MKTPTDVFNNMQLILAHIDDIKVARAITRPTPPIELSFGKKPEEVFQKTIELLEVLRDIAQLTKTGEVTLPAAPPEVLPKDIFQTTSQALQVLLRLKRRIGAADRAVATRTTIRISPSHVFSEAQRIIADLRVLKDAFEREQSGSGAPVH